MPFKPYHQFRNNSRLELLVNDFNTRGTIPPVMFVNFSRYHQGLIQKLKSAKFYFESLENLLANANILQAVDGSSDFFFKVNVYIDGYFYNSGSSLDILARVVLTLFNEPLTNYIYFDSAFKKISRTRPGDPILPKLQDPAWKNLFLDYRNTQTHEVLLLNQYSIQVENYGNPTAKIVFPLPDNPRSLPVDRRYQLNQDVIVYVKENFRRILSLTNIVYGEIYDRARLSGRLPL